MRAPRVRGVRTHGAELVVGGSGNGSVKKPMVLMANGVLVSTQNPQGKDRSSGRGGRGGRGGVGESGRMKATRRKMARANERAS